MDSRPRIIVSSKRLKNTKASEEYVSVKFYYPDVDKIWEGWIPVVYRRTGLCISEDDQNKLRDYINDVYCQMHPSSYVSWKEKQLEYWNNEHPGSTETKTIFDILIDGEWHCRNCEIDNANFARRIQDIKEYGYTISTHINYHCPICGNHKSTRLQLVPIDRVELAGNGYETWSPALRKRILKLLNNYDVYECCYSKHILPDHKFSEIRWDNDTKSINPDSMTDDEIKAKFQLLSNQRNQQKREVCRHCFQTGTRGSIYGITFFYEGGKEWDPAIPIKGKDAEKGCIGCPWYDIERWRNEILKIFSSYSELATIVKIKK